MAFFSSALFPCTQPVGQTTWENDVKTRVAAQLLKKIISVHPRWRLFSVNNNKSSLKITTFIYKFVGVSVASWSVGNFCPKMPNLGLKPLPTLGNVRAKLKFRAPKISSVVNIQLSVVKLQLPVPPTFLTHVAAE